MGDLRWARVQFTPASPGDRDAGLLGYVRARYGDLALDGITVRRTASGHLTLSWPARRDGRGRDHSLVRPTDDATRLELERAILGQLGLLEARP